MTNNMTNNGTIEADSAQEALDVAPEQSYRIESLVSGQDLGVWPGETPEQAIEAMDRAAGYASSDAALAVLGLSPDERRAELRVTPASESAS